MPRTTTKTLFREHHDYGFDITSTYFRPWVSIVSILAILLGVVVGVGVMAYVISDASCDRYGDRMQREVVYDFWGEGCYIETDEGRFIPTSQYRVTSEESS